MVMADVAHVQIVVEHDPESARVVARIDDAEDY